jgi:hypothetical protein
VSDTTTLRIERTLQAPGGVNSSLLAPTGVDRLSGNAVRDPGRARAAA